MPANTTTRSARGQRTVYIDMRPACRLVSPARGKFRIEWRNHAVDHSEAIKTISKPAVREHFLALIEQAEAAVWSELV